MVLPGSGWTTTTCRPRSRSGGRSTAIDWSKPLARAGAMGKRSVERKLRRLSVRLRRLREELVVIDEQLAHLVDDVDQASVRALVAEDPAAAIEHREAVGHSQAMADHRRHVIAEIQDLEVRQDELLDELRLL